MDSTLLPPPINDPSSSHGPSPKDHYNLRAKKQTTLQPIHADAGSSEPPAPPSHSPQDNSSLLHELRQKTKQLEATRAGQPTNGSTEPNQAVELVRKKIARLYSDEPDASEETRLLKQLDTPLSTHQTFMRDLSNSGKSLEEIQTAWHTYYVSLPEREKQQVWHEFYAANTAQNKHHRHEAVPASAAQKPAKQPIQHPRKHTTNTHQTGTPAIDPRSPQEIKSQILQTTQTRHTNKLTKKQHLKSLMFGIGMAALSLLLVTFVFFNDVYIAPLVSPNSSVSATPIIGAVDGPVGPESKIIIPKINLEVPVVFDLGSTQEIDIQQALEDGVVHYSTSPDPGEIGNSVIVGHSSNNIFNSGKYKFAFVLLRKLEPGDTFFVHKDSVRYTYKIYEKEVVAPTNVSVLGPQERGSTMTLITCDPPGTSINRLIIYAEQVSPDPSNNTASRPSANNETAVEPQQLPSNAPSLWSRLWPF